MIDDKRGTRHYFGQLQFRTITTVTIIYMLDGNIDDGDRFVQVEEHLGIDVRYLNVGWHVVDCPILWSRMPCASVAELKYGQNIIVSDLSGTIENQLIAQNIATEVCRFEMRLPVDCRIVGAGEQQAVPLPGTDGKC